MNDEYLINELLNTGECVTLDYKRKQYPFAGASDIQKAELLKDILAFSNAWRSTTAYILIGVTNDLEIIELDEDVDDAKIQEFVNTKTNTHISFSYRSLIFRGFKLGLFTIPVQERPIYLTKDFSTKLKRNEVYIRRGSSTTTANPTEIAKMGAAAATQQKLPASSPKFSVNILHSDGSLRDDFIHKYDGWKLLSIDKYLNIEGPTLDRTYYINKYYNKEKALFLAESRGKACIIFEIKNCGNAFGSDVRINISIPSPSEAFFKDEDQLLSRPQEYIKKSLSHLAFNNKKETSKYTSGHDLHRHSISFSKNKIQAGDVYRTPKIYLVNSLPSLKSLEISIFSDELKGPVKLTIPVSVFVNEQLLTMEVLKTN